MFFPIYVDVSSLAIKEVGDPIALDSAPDFTAKDRLSPVWPIDKNNIERRWRYGKEGVERELKNGLLKAVREAGRIEIKHLEAPTEFFLPKTLWLNKAFSGARGAGFLKAILGTDDAFSYPKSPYVVQELIRCVTHDKPAAIILDFFAGSGTTLHATVLMNAEDGGKRQCLLVTNNEVEEKRARELQKQGLRPGDSEYEKAGICQNVTWPRCKYSLNGVRDDGTVLAGSYVNGRELKDGFDENIQFFSLAFVDPALVERGDAFEGVLPILWLIAGAIGERESRRGSTPWYIATHSPFAVLIRETKFNEFRKALRDRTDIRCVFLVTDSDDNFAAMRRELGRRYRSIQLYKSYLDNFRINAVDKRAAGDDANSE